jgi:hypothetical protein
MFSYSISQYSIIFSSSFCCLSSISSIYSMSSLWYLHLAKNDLICFYISMVASIFRLRFKSTLLSLCSNMLSYYYILYISWYEYFKDDLWCESWIKLLENIECPNPSFSEFPFESILARIYTYIMVSKVSLLIINLKGILWLHFILLVIIHS